MSQSIDSQLNFLKYQEESSTAFTLTSSLALISGARIINWISSASLGGLISSAVLNHVLSYGTLHILSPESYLGKLICTISAVAMGTLLASWVMPSLGFSLALGRGLSLAISQVSLNVLSYAFFKFFTPTSNLPLNLSKKSLQEVSDTTLAYGRSYYAKHQEKWDECSLKEQIILNQDFLDKSLPLITFTRFEQLEGDQDLTQDQFDFFMEHTKKTCSHEEERLRNQLRYDYYMPPDKIISHPEDVPDLDFDIEISEISEEDFYWYYYAFKLKPDLLLPLSQTLKEAFSDVFYKKRFNRPCQELFKNPLNLDVGWISLLSKEAAAWYELQSFWDDLPFLDQILWNLRRKKEGKDPIPYHFIKEEIEDIHRDVFLLSPEDQFKVESYLQDYCKKDEKFATWYYGMPLSTDNISSAELSPLETGRVENISTSSENTGHQESGILSSSSTQVIWNLGIAVLSFFGAKGIDSQIKKIDVNQRLIQAVKQNAYRKVQMFVMLGRADIRVQDQQKSLLRCALETRNPDPRIIRFIPEKGGENPTYDDLMYAIWNNFSKDVIELLANEKTLSATDDVGKTALMHAIRGKRLSNDIIDLLIGKASINKRDTQSMGGASQANHKADNSAPGTNRSALVYALCYQPNNDALILNLLQKGAEVGGTSSNFYGDNGLTSLMLALRNKCSLRVLRAILDQGDRTPLLRAKDLGGRSALMYALEAGYEDSDFLNILEEGSREIVVDSQGKSLFGYAVQGGHLEIITQYFKKYERFINQGDNHQQTPLFYAVKARSEIEIIELLLNFKAEVDIQDANNDTPLMLALEHGCSDEVVQKLGAFSNLATKNNQGRDAFLYALSSKRSYKVIEFFLQRGFSLKESVSRNGITPLIQMFHSQVSPNIRKMILKCYDQQITEKMDMEAILRTKKQERNEGRKNSVLVYAVNFFASEEELDWLYTRGGEFEKEKETLLKMAIEIGNEVATKYLLNKLEFSPQLLKEMRIKTGKLLQTRDSDKQRCYQNILKALGQD